MKSATSAREMDGRPTLSPGPVTRYVPVSGPSVSPPGRAMIQSPPLARMICSWAFFSWIAWRRKPFDDQGLRQPAHLLQAVAGPERADPERAPDAVRCHGVQDVARTFGQHGRPAARAQGRYDDIVAGDGPPHGILVGDVALDDRQIGVLNGQGRGLAHESGHLMALARAWSTHWRPVPPVAPKMINFIYSSFVSNG